MMTYFLRWIAGRIWWSMALNASVTIWRRTAPLTMATVDLAAGSCVKVSGGVPGPFTCARSADKAPAPAAAWKKYMREKFIARLQTEKQTIRSYYSDRRSGTDKTARSEEHTSELQSL